MSDFTIRSATSEDASVLSALASRTFNDTFAGVNSPEDMAAHNARSYGAAIQREEIESPSIRTLLVEAAGQAIAYAQLRQIAAPACVDTQPTIELWRFYVDKAAIGRGVAQRLMDAVLQVAKDVGANSIWLGVWEHNPRAIAFYRKCLFSEIGSHVFQLGADMQTDLIFERALRA